MRIPQWRPALRGAPVKLARKENGLRVFNVGGYAHCAIGRGYAIAYGTRRNGNVMIAFFAMLFEGALYAQKALHYAASLDKYVTEA